MREPKFSDVVFVQQPGPLPTMVRHPGRWWQLVQDAGFTPSVVDVNYEWWRSLDVLSESLADARHHYDVPDRSAEWKRLLAALQQSATYTDISIYHRTISGICLYLETLSTLQRDFEVKINTGAISRHVDCGLVGSIVQFATSQSYLRESFKFALDVSAIPSGAVCALRITSYRDLARAALMASVLREMVPDVHICLYDHSYENGSLQPHLRRVKASTPLLQVFDSIIESHEGRDELLVEIARSRKLGIVGRARKGAIRFAATRGKAKPVAFPLLPSFTPAPLLMTRFSERRCYWSRCTYCVQNNKYDDPRGPSRSEVSDFVARLESFAATGYRHFLFSDEALSPSVLSEFCAQIRAADLKIRWGGRSKMERAFTPQLLKKLKGSGCFEILFGLETMDPDVQRLMDKFDPRIDDEATRRVFAAFRESGVSMHINLITGFPGDSLESTRRTIDFVKGNAAGLPAPTFILNKFVVFENTPVALDPERFSIHLQPDNRDLPVSLPFEYLPEAAKSDVTMEKVLELADELSELEAWGWIRKEPYGAITRNMLSGGPHGVFFKSRATGAVA